MTAQTLTQLWPQWFPDCPPFSPAMRNVFRERWFRIYSLPDGERYATTDDEVATILRRHNDMAEAVIGDGAACAVIVAGEADEPPSLRALGAQRVEGWLEGWMGDEYFADWLEGIGDFFVGFFTWRRDQFNDLLHDIAEDRVNHLLFVSLGSGRVYAPYDGGANLFLESEKVMDDFHRRFAMWRSPREDGL